MNRWSRVLVAAGSVLMLLGLLSGTVNRQVLDGQRFAAHADAIRTDPAVSREAGVLIARELIVIRPDLVALRPLLESTAGSLVASPAFGPVVRTAVVPVHRAFTSGDDQVILRLADVGAVLTAAVQTLSPEASARLPAGLDVTLARFGEQGFAAHTLRAASTLRTLTWLLPLLALLCFAGALSRRNGRRRTVRGIGVGIASAGLLTATAVFVATIIFSRVETDSFRRALLVASWGQLEGPLWRLSAVTTATGYVLLLAASSAAGVGSFSPRAIVTWLRRPSRSPRSLALHGAVLIGIAVATILRPHTAVTIAVVVIGFLVLLHGLFELGSALRSSTRDRGGPVGAVRRILSRPEVRVTGGIVAALAVVTAIVFWNGSGASEKLAARTTSTRSTACNGWTQLCDRRYDQVAFPATHNSMAVADEPGWFLAEQPTGVIGQLEDGVRVFLIDSWYGQHTQRTGVIANTEQSRAKALAEARATYGEALLNSALRVRNSLDLTPRGPVRPYLCHTLCELGSTDWEPLMVKVRVWMEQHPREVVTFFIQDTVTPADTATLFDDAGLTKYAYTPTPGRSWPTLGQMIDSGKRLVVLSENEGGGATYPWLLQGFDEVQDTPFDSRRVSDFSCRLNRGRPDSPLFLVNHWLNNSQRRVSDARTVNAASILGPRLRQCEQERGKIPNYVAVDYYNLGALFSEVDRLNGVGAAGDLP